MTRARVSIEDDGRVVDFETEDGARVRVSLPAPRRPGSRRPAPPEVRARAVIGAIAAEADRGAAADAVDEGLDETFPASDPVAASEPSAPPRRRD